MTLTVTAGTASAAGQVGQARFRSADVIDGPDVSSYQHPYGARINWHEVARTHKDFAIVKATEGAWYRNPWFKRDYYGARRAGLVRGSYHFARPGYPLERTARHQANFFVAHLGDVNTTNTLPPALDLETTGGLSRGALVTWAQLFLLQVRKVTGRTPLIYTYPNFWTEALSDPAALARYPLWMASYSSRADSSATLWQYTAGARVSGIRDRVDMSVFTEPVEVWDALRDGRTPSPWPAQAPGAPQHVTPTGGDGTIAVSWLPGDTGSTAVQHYTVTVTPTDGSPSSSVTVSGLTTSATVDGLTNGLPYTVNVTASNYSGDGEPSNEAGPVVPLVPTTLTIGGPLDVNYGSDARVAVRLVRPDTSHGLPGRTVTVEQKVYDGTGSDWTPLPDATTDAHGWVVLHVTAPQHNIDLRFTYTGPAGWHDATRIVNVVVRNHATAGLTKHRVRHGHSVVLHGRISPVVGGVQVRRQIYYGGAWHDAGRTMTGLHGYYQFRFVPPSKGVHAYRVVVAAFDGRSHGFSPVRHVRVH